MKILISSFGTRGDVQPYLALAVGLQGVGHHVTLATSHNYTEWIQAYGVHTHPTRFNPTAPMQDPETQAILRSRNLLRQFRLFRDAMRLSVEAQDEAWVAIQDVDFVIQSPTGTGALEAATQRHIPVAFASPVPFAPTRAFPSFFLGPLRFSLGAGYNRLTHALMHRALWSGMGGPMTNHLRQQLGLRAWRSYGELLEFGRSLGVPWLYSFSTHVIPKPADWDEFQHITGYWFLEAQPNWQPPTDLLRFVESGPPPISVGFGSINVGEGEAKTRLVLRALELSGQRSVVLTGWGGLTPISAPPNVLFVENVPHAWLFSRVAAVVHHGGAGTTAAGLRAGVPSIITPIAGDQSAWAEQVVKLGVSPRAPSLNQLSAEKLAEAIQIAVTDSSLRARAAALGEKIRAEDGMARAIEIIERHAAGFNQRA